MARRHPSALLLAAQLLSLLLYPLMDDTQSGRVLFGAVGAGGGAAGGVGGQPQPGGELDRLAAGAAGGGAVGGRDRARPAGPDRGRPSMLEAALYFYAAASLISYMLHDHRVTADELYRGRRDVHAAGVGLRLRVLRLPGVVPGQLHRRGRPGAAAQLDRTAVPELLHALQRRQRRHRAAGRAGAGAGDARAVRRRGLHRHGGVAPDRIDDPAPASASAAEHQETTASGAKCRATMGFKSATARRHEAAV